MSAAAPLPEQDLRAALAQSERALRALRGASLLITGGTGFFGAWLMETLAYGRAALSLDVTVDLLTRDPAGYAARMPHIAALPWVRLRGGDVRALAPAGARYSHVVHAATSTSAAPGEPHDPMDLASVVVDGAIRVLRTARACGASRVLFTSSGAVYGRIPPGVARVREDAPGAPDALDPGQVYGAAKRLAESLCVASQREGGPAAVVARCFAFVGAHLPLDRHFAIGNFLRDGLRGGPVVVQGDGTPMRSYLYGSDLAAWLWVMLAEGEGGRAYNVGSDEALSLREIATRVGAHFGAPVEVRGERAEGGPRSVYVPDVGRARAELGLEVTVPLDEAIRRTATWIAAARDDESDRQALS